MRMPGRRRRLTLLLGAAVALVAGAPLGAQTPNQESVARGRVATPAGDALRGVTGIWVVLHRVGRDDAGPVDSVRTGRDGTYRIPYVRTGGDDEALYFVSARYADIAYFSPPMPPGGSTEDEGEIIVYDTTSTGVPIRLQGRHIVLSGGGVDGMRDIVEVYEVVNESDRTLISPDDVTPTWSGTLPASASDVRIGEGDVAAEAMRITPGKLDVLAPIAPGLKAFSLAYRVPASAFPLNIRIDSSTALLEFLLEDPAMRIEGAGLTPTDAVNIEGRLFRRFMADSVAAGSVVRVSVPALAQSNRTMYVAIIIIAVMAAMLIALARAFARRTPQTAPVAAVPPIPKSADALAREIAALDEEMERKPPTDREMREAFAARRAALKDALARALAAEQGRR